MNPYRQKDMAETVAASPQKITITKTRPACFVVSLNKKPLAEFSELADAEQYATRYGWRGNGRPAVGPASLVNETTRRREAFRLGANEAVLLAVGPSVKFA